ncbi:hypothetical protein DFH09DRAFT_1099064 [Mycena vulgaris]|nr:hypothetical protein DFH09DRAFT_1099064 [Mycena vulgaris]
MAKHHSSEAKKASDEDSEGLQKEVLLAEGARVMITRNAWTSKGLVNSAQGTVKRIWVQPGFNPQIIIHKSQGLTLNRAVIDLGQKDFSSGLSFVVISRVKNWLVFLSGLRLA